MAENKLAKVSIIGAGNVGSTCAFLLVANSLADIIFFDKLKNLAQAKALDIGQAAVALGSGSRVKAADSLKELSGSELVVIAAGLPRKPGMSRQDLVKTNASIAAEISAAVKEYASQAIVIVVSNPLDILTWVVLKQTGFDRRRVFGMAGLVDNSRLRYFTAQKAKISSKQVKSHVLGQHGDQMVIPEERVFIDGRPVSEVMDQAAIAEIKTQTRKAGSQIVELLKDGSAYFLPGTAAFLMAKAVIKDTSELFDTCVYLEGEYGLTGVCLGVPAVVGKSGIQKITGIDLNKQSAEELKENARLFKVQLQML